jgi:hypothetical protein
MQTTGNTEAADTSCAVRWQICNGPKFSKLLEVRLPLQSDIFQEIKTHKEKGLTFVQTQYLYAIV